MKALVLCAGFGRRLGKLCERTPKPLLSLGPCTIIEHIVMQLRNAGVHDVFVNLHFQPQCIPEVLGTGREFGVNIEYLHEPALLGTAGSARSLRDRLGDSALLVHYGDIVTNHPLADLQRCHERTNAAVTAMVHRRRNSNSRAWVAPDGRITKFEERPEAPLPPNSPTPHVFSGVALLSPRTVRELPERVPLDLPHDVFRTMAEDGRLFAHPLSGYRWAIDSPQKLLQARVGLAARRTPGATAPTPQRSAV